MDERKEASKKPRPPPPKPKPKPRAVLREMPEEKLKIGKHAESAWSGDGPEVCGVRVADRPDPVIIEQHSVMHLPMQEGWSNRTMSRAQAEMQLRYVATKRVGMEADDWRIVEVGHTWIDDRAILSMYEVERQIGASTCVPDVGASTFAVDWMLARLQSFGLTMVKLRSGPDGGTIVLVNRVVAKREQPTMLEQAQVRVHRSLGGLERWFKLLQEQVKTIKYQLEEGIKGTLTFDLDVMPWMVRHAPWQLARFTTLRPAGVTAYKAVHGKDYDSPLLFFGENILARRPESLELGVHRRGRQSSRWMGSCLVTKRFGAMRYQMRGGGVGHRSRR